MEMVPNNADVDIPQIVPRKLSRSTACPCSGAGVGGTKAAQNEAVFNNILCLPETSPERSEKAGGAALQKTQNSKYVTHSDTVDRGGTTYKVNQGKAGIYSRILHRAIDELDKSLLLWGRVFALRFDLHHKGICKADNKWLSRLFKNLKRRLERSYGIAEMGYCWVREQERGKSQHYHAVLFIDGDEIRHPAKISKIITDTWSSINPVNTAYFPRNQYYFVDCSTVKHDLVYRMSYLAKVRGKGYRDKDTNDFFCSNLPKRKEKI